MNRRAIGAAALVLGLVGMGAGYLSAQEQYSNTLNQIGVFFGAGNSFFSLLIANPLFLLGIVAGFVGLVLVLMPAGSSSSSGSPTSAKAATSGTRQCPYCAEQVQKAAKVCRWCGRDISETR